MTFIKPILTFLRNAHFLHGFLFPVVLFNLIGNGLVWFVVDGSDPSLSLLPFAWLLISVLFGIAMAFSWDDMEQRRIEWAAYRAREQEHRDAMIAKGRTLKAFYRNHPDFLGVSLHSSLYLELHVKAAPYGHPFPHVWDDVEVKLVVDHCNSWPNWDIVKAS